MKKSAEIWANFKQIIEDALAQSQVPGWSVTQEITQDAQQPALRARRIRSEQYGAQTQQYKTVQNQLTLITRERVVLTWQIDAVCPVSGANAPEWSAPDVLGLLRNYFSGPFGTAALRAKGFSLAEKIRFIDEITSPAPKESPETNPFLQMKLFYVNEDVYEVPALTAVENQGIKGV